MRVFIEELKSEDDWNHAIYFSDPNLLTNRVVHPSVMVNSKRLAEFLKLKIEAEYETFKTKAEIHNEEYRKTHPRKGG